MVSQQFAEMESLIGQDHALSARWLEISDRLREEGAADKANKAKWLTDSMMWWR